jgi:hypothetical protein
MACLCVAKSEGSAAQFQASGVYKPTIRAFYYKLFSIDAILENSQKMYKGLVRMLTDVRIEGTDPEVRPDTFADESRDAADVDEIESLEDWVHNQVSDIKDLTNGEITFETHGWCDQPKYVEVWIEKQGMYYFKKNTGHITTSLRRLGQKMIFL